MAFPTIPTTGANTLLSSTTTTASTTHTFPSLTTLAPAAGDLIIAICVQYSGTTGGSPNDQFSAWGASLSEILDDETTTANDLAVGVAYKVATGSESGTFTVTSATAARSVNFLMRIPAGTWHGTTIPEVAAAVRATGAAADAGSLNPANWDAEDTLWIIVFAQSETTTTGTPPVLTASPTNFSGDLIVARNADAVGHITAGVGFRQNNASSEDPGVYTGTNLVRGNGLATTIAVRPPPPTQTSVARISLAPGSAPDVDTGHSIKVRARTTAGAGTIRAALYEGANNRSGDLESSALTTSLADYTLSISEANAANITDYSDLEIRLWGYAAGGGAIVFEVDQLWLETPEAGAVVGAVVFPITFTAVTNSRVTRRSSVVYPISFNRVVTARVTARSRVDEPITFQRVVTGRVTRYGATATPITFGVITDGTSAKDGAVSLPVTFERVVTGRVTARSAVAAPFTFGAVTSGTRTTRSAVTFPITFGITTNGEVEGGAETIFGSAVFAITDTITTNGVRTTYGATVVPETFTVTTNGVRERYGAVSLPITFGVTSGAGKIAAAGLVYLFGDALEVVQGRGAASLELTATIVTAGRVTARSAVAFPITFGVATNTEGVVTGRASSEWTFERVTASKRTTRSAVAFTITDAIVTAARVTARGRVALPVTFGLTTVGRATYRARVALPITFGITVRGTAAGNIAGDLSMPITVGVTTAGFATHYASSSLATTFQVTTAAKATLRSSSTLAITATIQTLGVTTRFGRVALPIILDIQTRGVGAGMVAGRTSLDIVATITTAELLYARSRVSLPITVTIGTSPRQTAYSSIDLPLVFNIKSGNPIYLSGTNGYIAFAHWGIPRRTGSGRIARPKVGSLA